MRHRYGFVDFIVCIVFAPLACAQQIDHNQHESSPIAKSESGLSDADSSSAAEHVAPEPPQHVMGDMSYQSMVATMQMDDTVRMSRVLLDELEWRNTSESDAAVWNAQAWYGNDYNKAVIKTEGERANHSVDARAELLWDRIVARWWSVQTGLRQDFGAGPSRTWAAIGVAGLAPYWFDVEATLYIGDAGRTAMRINVDYDLRLTQRLLVSSGIEASWYGKSDLARQVGSGLSFAEAALRLRYEMRREFAPYLGIAWQRKFGKTNDYARDMGLDMNDVQAVAGLRIWF